LGKLGRNYFLTRSRQQLPYGGKQSSVATEIASWLLAAGALFLVLRLHVLVALLAGLLVYELVHLIAPLLQRCLSNDRARLVAVVVLSVLIVGLLTAAILCIVLFFRSEVGSLSALVRRMADIIEGNRNTLPDWLLASLPTNPDQLREAIVQRLRANAPTLQLAGWEAGRAFAQLLIGMVIGAMVALYEAARRRTEKPLARALTDRIERLGNSFRQVVFAQIRISAVNATFTGLYLVVVLPLFGVHLPFSKTLIVVTFLTGLLPVVGNLISNTVIVIVSLSHSVHAASASLAFLIIIHKLEYFLNARIIGTQIQSRPWEILIAMVVMEAAFGVPGVVAAPIYYAYLKQELADRGLV
jgi:predicted PurR-regulated permease PerM